MVKLFLAALISAFLMNVASASPFDPRFDSHWENFKRVYQKEYKGNEESTRRFIWESHVNQIIEHNLEYDLGFHTYRQGLNEYADYSHEEFVLLMNGYRGRKLNNTISAYVPLSNIDLPSTVDWRKQGLVTGVKNQQQCGSCWAFSTTGSLEGQHKKKTGQLVSLSEQNLVDCSGAECNMGCEGGLMDQGFEYIKKNNGIDTEQSYPYTAQDGTCKFSRSNVGATVTGFVDVASGDESSLQQAVATIGPISVAIDASQESFQLYQGGIYNEPSCNSFFLDHGVLAVGYGTENGDDYWLVKNRSPASYKEDLLTGPPRILMKKLLWGTTWGDKGYIKMSRNKNNQCGIATQASYPLV